MKLTSEQNKKVFDAVKEINDSMIRIAAEKDLIKDTLEMVQEKYGLNKKIVSKMAKMYHKQNLNEAIAEIDEITELYESVTGLKVNANE